MQGALLLADHWDGRVLEADGGLQLHDGEHAHDDNGPEQQHDNRDSDDSLGEVPADHRGVALVYRRLERPACANLAFRVRGL